MSSISFRSRRHQTASSKKMVMVMHGVGNMNGSPLGYAPGSTIDEDCLDSLMNLDDADIFNDFVSTMEDTFRESNKSPGPPLANIPKKVSMEIETHHEKTDVSPRNQANQASPVVHTISPNVSNVGAMEKVPIGQKLSPPVTSFSKPGLVSKSSRPAQPSSVVRSESSTMANPITSTMMNACIEAQNQQHNISPVSVASPLLLNPHGNFPTLATSPNFLSSMPSLDTKIANIEKQARPQMTVTTNSVIPIPSFPPPTMAGMVAALVSHHHQRQGWIQKSVGGIILPQNPASNVPLTNPIYEAALALKQKKAKKKEMRRDRNRIHAKQSRQRKKSLTDTLEHSLEDLKQENDLLKQRIRTVIYRNSQEGEALLNKSLQDHIAMTVAVRSSIPHQRFVERLLNHKTLDNDTISFLRSLSKKLHSSPGTSPSQSSELSPTPTKLDQRKRESNTSKNSKQFKKENNASTLLDIAVTIG